MKYITPTWSAPGKVKALTTIRNSPKFSDYNKDMELTKAALAESIPKPLAWLKQTHSNTCAIVDGIDHCPEADAAISFTGEAACCILTADCVPIILTDAAATFVAAIHAGWRGIENGVIEQTLSKINAENIIAWIGPCICNSCYVVTDELKNIFTSKDMAFGSCFNENTFGLKKACKIILSKHHVTKVYETSFCTSCDNDLFYSARREGIESGRIITCIWKDH